MVIVHFFIVILTQYLTDVLLSLERDFCVIYLILSIVFLDNA